MEAGVVRILPGYMDATGMRMVRGRSLNWNDFTHRTEAAVISESGAASLFPGEDPIGRELHTTDRRLLNVVGVAADAHRGFEFDSRIPPVYAIDHGSGQSLTVVARMRSRGPGTATDIHRQIARMAPGAPATIRWWSDSINSLPAYRTPRFQTILLGAFAGLAIMLTAVGIFAVVSSLVGSIRREIGIRIAVGASPSSVIRLIVQHVMTAVVVATLAGAMLAQWLGTVAGAYIASLEARDAPALAASIAIVFFAALAASYVPARRVWRVDPIAVLRTE